MFGALSECVARRREALAEVTRAEKSELLACRWPRQRGGRVSAAAPYRHLANRTASLSAAAAAAVDELRDRGVGDCDEVPLAVESLAAVTCVGRRKHGDWRRELRAAGRAHRRTAA